MPMPKFMKETSDAYPFEITCAPAVAPANTGCFTKKWDSIGSEELKDSIPGMHVCVRSYTYGPNHLLFSSFSC
jgi:hypothetical protein